MVDMAELRKIGVIVNLAIWFAIHAMFARVHPVRGFGFSFDAPEIASANVATELPSPRV